MHGAGRAGEVVDLVDLEQYGLDDVVADHLEPGVPEVVRDVPLAPREEVVHDDDAVAALHQPVHQVAPHEAGAARHEHPQRAPPQAQGHLAADGGLAEGRVPADGEVAESGRRGGVGRGGCGGGGEGEEGGGEEHAGEGEDGAVLGGGVAGGAGEPGERLGGLRGVLPAVGGGAVRRGAAPVRQLRRHLRRRARAQISVGDLDREQVKGWGHRLCALVVAVAT